MNIYLRFIWQFRRSENKHPSPSAWRRAARTPVGFCRLSPIHVTGIHAGLLPCVATGPTATFTNELVGFRKWGLESAIKVILLHSSSPWQRSQRGFLCVSFHTLTRSLSGTWPGKLHFTDTCYLLTSAMFFERMTPTKLSGSIRIEFISERPRGLSEPVPTRQTWQPSCRKPTRECLEEEHTWTLQKMRRLQCTRRLIDRMWPDGNWPWLCWPQHARSQFRASPVSSTFAKVRLFTWTCFFTGCSPALLHSFCMCGRGREPGGELYFCAHSTMNWLRPHTGPADLSTAL